MLTGNELGAAIEAAVEKKGITKKKLAEDFGVKPPSVQGWIKSGRIDKARLFEMMEYFSDVVDATHWGLSAGYNSAISSADLTVSDKAGKVLNIEIKEPAKSGAAAKVMEMLQKHGKSLTGSAQERLLQAVSESLEEARTGKVITADFSRAPKLMDGDILIPQYDLRASMGHGQVPADYVEFMRNVVVSGVQLEKLGLDFTSPANLSIITGWGESMAPTIKSKDPVIVDRGITEFMGDGVYVITWDDMLYIKRLQNAGDGRLELISDNPKHKDRVVNADEVTIHARVLLVWGAQKL